jgi:hypothetical protein
MTSTRSRSLAAIAVGAMLLAPLAGCGGDDTKKAGSTSSGASSTATAGIDKNVFIDDLVKEIDTKKYVHMNIDGGSLFKADADVDFSGAHALIAMTATLGGGSRQMVLAGNALYMQQSPGGKYSKLGTDDPTFGSILKTFSGLGPRDTVAGMKPGITKIVDTGAASIDGVKMTRYKITADPDKTSGAFKALAGSAGGPSTIALYFYVDAQKLVHRIETEVSGQKITMQMSDWGKPVSIKVPSGDQVLGSN